MLKLSRARLRASSVLLALAASFGVLAGTASPAHAMTSYQAGIMHEASAHRGDPYQYGAAGPHRFDCSGFTLYVFRRVGKTLPHNAASQYARVHHVAKSTKTIGDLIFFRDSSGHIYHVGIYAGSNRIWHAPHSGSSVKLAPIWTSSYVVGRV